MAFNKFVGRDRAWLEATRTALQDALITGQAIKIQIAGVLTEFDPTKQDLGKLLEDIQYAISLLEDADPNDPCDQSPKGQRVMSVRTHFGGVYE
jgi:hypothetical protein